MLDELGWIYDYGFWGSRVFDLPNFLVCIVLVLAGGKLLRVSPVIQIVLVLHCVLPFFLNEVLFDYDYMPDQFKYWRWFNQIRSGDLDFFAALVGDNTQQAAALFSIMPLPAAVAPLSLGFFNSFLYVALFYWLYSKKVFTPFSMWFFLLYPSMAMYSALSLRETWIVVSMVVAVQLGRERRWLLMTLFLLPLYMLKFQNFYILAPVLVLYILLGIRNKGISVGNGFALFSLGVAALVALSPFVLPLVNKFRFAMHVEDGGDVMDVQAISSPLEFVVQGVTSGIYFLLKPFFWEAGNLLQMLQSFENLFVAMLLFLVTKRAWAVEPRKLVFWVLLFVFSMSVYGVVVANFGTAARYRYPFIIVYVLFVCAECQVHSVLPSLRRYHPKVKVG